MYRNGTQYDTLGKLKLAIKQALKSITVDFRKILPLSAWSRAIAVVEEQGRNIAINSVKDILGVPYSMSQVINVLLRLRSTMFSTKCVYPNPHLPLEAHEREDSTQVASALVPILAAARAQNVCSDSFIWLECSSFSKV